MTENDDALRFPDAPRAALDRALKDLVEHAQKVLETQGRLRALLRADQAMLTEPDLPAMLHRIVDAAVELIGADYGGLAVIAPQGGVEEFVFVGMTPEQVEKIGPLPQGHGLVGALIEDPRPIRLEHLRDDPRSVGFPPNHPEMDAFLGVPIRVGGEVFGNLYLTNAGAKAFTADDEELAVSLAATAGFAINNARLYHQTRRRQEWIGSTSELVAEVLAKDVTEPLSLVAERLALLAQARTVHVVKRSQSGRSGDRNWSLVPIATGDNEASPGELSSLGLTRTILDEAAAPGETVVLPVAGRTPSPVNDPPPTTGSRIAVPIQGPTTVDALIILARPESSPSFGPFDLELTDLVSRHASLALQLASARADRQRMELADDRARIARDLHDLVIQQIYAAGLELQTAIGMTSDAVLIDRVSHAVDALDASIVQIRNIVFALSTTPSEGDVPLRYKLFDLANEYSGALSSTPSVSFTGAVDVLVRDGLADDIVAVARESLTNVVKHSRAKNASLNVSVAGDDVVLEVVDDGVGMGTSSRRSGLANIEQRAVDRGGRFELDSGSHGTRVRWRAPLESAARSR